MKAPDTSPIADTSELDSKLREIEIHRPPTIEGKPIVTSRLSNKEITQIKAILDTEIAKARIEELEEVLHAGAYPISTVSTDTFGRRSHKYITKRLAQLKPKEG